jgi:hypothetical protein
MVIRLAGTLHLWIGETRPAEVFARLVAAPERSAVSRPTAELRWPRRLILQCVGLRFGTRDLGSRDAASGLGRGRRGRVVCWERHLRFLKQRPVLFVLGFLSRSVFGHLALQARLKCGRLRINLSSEDHL